MKRCDESDSYAAMKTRIREDFARERRRQERLARAERRDLIQRERAQAQAQALSQRRPDKHARQVAALTRRIAELEARLGKNGKMGTVPFCQDTHANGLGERAKWDRPHVSSPGVPRPSRNRNRS